MSLTSPSFQSVGYYVDLYLLFDNTSWKVSKYVVISGPYFLIFSVNTGKYGLEINSVFGHLSRSVTDVKRLSDRFYSLLPQMLQRCVCVKGFTYAENKLHHR